MRARATPAPSERRVIDLATSQPPAPRRREHRDDDERHAAHVRQQVRFLSGGILG